MNKGFSFFFLRNEKTRSKTQHYIEMLESSRASPKYFFPQKCLERKNVLKIPFNSAFLIGFIISFPGSNLVLDTHALRTGDKETEASERANEWDPTGFGQKTHIILGCTALSHTRTRPRRVRAKKEHPSHGHIAGSTFSRRVIQDISSHFPGVKTYSMSFGKKDTTKRKDKENSLESLR